MALPPVWQPDPERPGRGLSDWRALLGFGVGGVVALAMIGLVIVMITFLVLVFTADGDGKPSEDIRMIGSPAGGQGVGQAVRDGGR